MHIERKEEVNRDLLSGDISNGNLPLDFASCRDILRNAISRKICITN